MRSGVKRGTNWIFVNDMGSAWNGNLCPNCFKDKKRAYDRAYRAPKSKPMELLGPDTPLFATKMRLCKVCSKLTPNYFRCADCFAIASYQGRSICDMAVGF